MPKIRTLFILGILLILLHVFPGFPTSWKSAFSIIIGILILLLTFFHYREMRRKYGMKKELSSSLGAPAYVQNDSTNLPR
ncbi:MAG: hypothetical protein ABI430_01975 [Candidatus Taylorbacteria bacterium]